MPKIKLSENRCNRCGVMQFKPTNLCENCSKSFEQEANGKPITKKN